MSIEAEIAGKDLTALIEFRENDKVAREVS